jgi:dolichyldiphosphatase
MAYFATFLLCHVRFRHRFTPTGNNLVDMLLRFVVATALVTWAGGVAYSRWVICPPGYEPQKLIA